MTATEARSAGQANLSLLLLTFDREWYAVPSENVREIVRCRPWTPVPGAPAALPGIISQRGAIMPVVELRRLLGLAERPLTRSARLVLARCGDVDMALLVEAVVDLLDVAADAVEPAPGALDMARSRLLSGIVRHDGQPVALLDMAAVVSVLREGG